MTSSNFNLSLAAPLLPTQGGTGKNSSKLAAASEQFEALLIGEMLKSVREAGGEGWMGGGADASAESAFGIAENQLAQTMAAQGGLGLAKAVRRAMESPLKADSQTADAS